MACVYGEASGSFEDPSWIFNGSDRLMHFGQKGIMVSEDGSKTVVKLSPHLAVLAECDSSRGRETSISNHSGSWRISETFESSSSTREDLNNQDDERPSLGFSRSISIQPDPSLQVSPLVRPRLHQHQKRWKGGRYHQAKASK